MSHDCWLKHWRSWCGTKAQQTKKRVDIGNVTRPSIVKMQFVDLERSKVNHWAHPFGRPRGCIWIRVFKLGNHSARLVDWMIKWSWEIFKATICTFGESAARISIVLALSLFSFLTRVGTLFRNLGLLVFLLPVCWYYVKSVCNLRCGCIKPMRFWPNLRPNLLLVVAIQFLIALNLWLQGKDRAMDKEEEENAEAFFASAPPLKNRDTIASSVEDFIKRRIPSHPTGSPSSSSLCQCSAIFYKTLKT